MSGNHDLTGGMLLPKALIQITVCDLRDQEHDLRLSWSATVMDVKKALERRVAMPPRKQHLYHLGQELANEQVLAHSGVKAGSTLQLSTFSCHH